MPATRATQDDYERIVEPYRRELHAHCFRMLGCSADAEEALQEALLRAWRGLPEFEGRSSVRSWLYRISTNACLDAIKRRKPVVPIDYEPAEDVHDREPEALAPSPETVLQERDSVERALIAAVDRLHPLPRAVLIMRTVLGFSAREAAEALDTTVASVNSALQRARRAIDERPEDDGPALRDVRDRRARALVDGCAAAMRRGDVAAVVRLLAADA
jgi:RNA polymerase sigma-70 factor, ECF subfamily